LLRDLWPWWWPRTKLGRRCACVVESRVKASEVMRCIIWVMWFRVSPSARNRHWESCTVGVASVYLSAGGALQRLVRLAGGRDKLIRLVSEHQKIECMDSAVFYLMYFDSHWGKDTKLWGKGYLAES